MSENLSLQMRGAALIMKVQKKLLKYFEFGACTQYKTERLMWLSFRLINKLLYSPLYFLLLFVVHVWRTIETQTFTQKIFSARAE